MEKITLTMAVKAVDMVAETRDISEPITPPRPASRKFTTLTASSCQLTVPSAAKRPDRAASWSWFSLMVTLNF